MTGEDGQSAGSSAPSPRRPLPGRAVPTAAAIADIVARLKARRPRVHVIASPMAQPFTADVLLALGAEPTLTVSPEEVPAFVAAADAVLISLGMLDRVRRDSSLTAIEVAKDAGVPWLLDPVRIDVVPARMSFARRLMDLEPAIVHANAVEFRALAGVEASDDSAREEAIRALTTIAVTGEVDIVTDGKRLVRVANGHPLMARLAAIGCAGLAVAAAFRAVEPDSVMAAAAALVAMGVAGEVAAISAGGPGSFAVELLDALWRLDEETVTARTRLGRGAAEAISAGGDR